jgi:hypothetical protein
MTLNKTRTEKYDEILRCVQDDSLPNTLVYTDLACPFEITGVDKV